MQAAAPGHDDSPDASQRTSNGAHKHPLGGRPRPTIEPPELRDVVAFSVQFDSHNEPKLAVVHQSDLLSARAVAPPDGRYSTAPLPEVASKLAHEGESVPTVRHYTATVHEVVEPARVPMLAGPGVVPVAGEPAPRASRVPLAAAGVVVAAALFGYLLGRQQPVIDFAHLPPTGAGPSAKAAMGPTPTLERPVVPAAPATPATPAALPAPAALPTPATAALPTPAPASPATAAVAAPDGATGIAPSVAPPAAPVTESSPPALARVAPEAPAARPARVARDAAPATAAPAATTALAPSPASARPAAVTAPLPVEPSRPAAAAPCTENIAALGLCTLKP